MLRLGAPAIQRTQCDQPSRPSPYRHASGPDRGSARPAGPRQPGGADGAEGWERAPATGRVAGALGAQARRRSRTAVTPHKEAARTAPAPTATEEAVSTPLSRSPAAVAVCGAGAWAGAAAWAEWS